MKLRYSSDEDEKSDEKKKRKRYESNVDYADDPTRKLEVAMANISPRTGESSIDSAKHRDLVQKIITNTVPSYNSS